MKLSMKSGDPLGLRLSSELYQRSVPLTFLQHAARTDEPVHLPYLMRTPAAVETLDIGPAGNEFKGHDFFVGKQVRAGLRHETAQVIRIRSGILVAMSLKMDHVTIRSNLISPACLASDFAAPSTIKQSMGVLRLPIINVHRCCRH
jgi:hypothetical protein